MTRRKKDPLPKLAAIGSLPLFGIGIGALWLLYKAIEVRGGKEWRGYAGTVSLKPSVIYRFDFIAPPSAAIDRSSAESRLAEKGARNFQWNVVPDGTHLYFDQSFPEGATLTFGKSGMPPLLALTARRIDGLDWEAP